MKIDPAQAKWFKSSHSTSGGECVEAAHLHGGMVGVRDSTLGTESPVLLFDGPAWDAFTDSVRAGGFDHA
ncbi:Domain of uncharacterised function (DUF397) [Nocardia otitidiscaviarum]|uniref:Domain of uncharacterized function (DUF397) n=1 Tax=Nocardia otitidiscaviarum TaxID=1823 RepID=A0A378YU26_9NOCA|nr:DUF397 domain-containing protein [Nocardia otitidiscaviarum]SUA80624.1 Domain of uncharacterised function (DUF397) [Nocardia otitidiscaviarum]